MNRITLAILGAIAGAFLALAADETLSHPPTPLTFQQRWEPADSLPDPLDYSTPLEEIPAWKADRGPCVERRPRCQLV
jgi:hypothetical protein